jgi:hypothetical protein
MEYVSSIGSVLTFVVKPCALTAFTSVERIQRSRGTHSPPEQVQCSSRARLLSIWASSPGDFDCRRPHGPGRVCQIQFMYHSADAMGVEGNLDPHQDGPRH